MRSLVCFTTLLLGCANDGEVGAATDGSSSSSTSEAQGDGSSGGDGSFGVDENSCLPVCVADTDAITAGVQPLCVVTGANSTGQTIDLQECGPSDMEVSTVCYVVRWDAFGGTESPDDDLSAACTDVGANAELELIWPDEPLEMTLSMTCQLSSSPDVDCPQLG